ncbi:MFS transporter [Kitasatospora humi]|uniref:MFS transporter n=1 Tax=Kitasatospora humi TaxID=2893891 RepID=UPI00355787DD
MFAGQLVNRVGSMAVPFLVLYLGNQGMSTSDAGTVLAAVGLGGLVSQPLGGALADRFGPRAALVAGLAASAVSIVCLGAARGLPAILAAAVLVGVVADVYRPAAAALVAAVVPADSRPRAFSLIYWAVNLGVGLAGLLAGVLARHGFGLLFLVQAGSAAGFALLVGLLVPGRIAAPRSRLAAREGGGGPLRDRLLLALIALNIVSSLINAQVTMGLPLAIKDSGQSSAVYGSVFLVSGVLIGVLQPPLAGWLERFDRIVVLAVSWAVFGLGIAATGLAHTALEYLATVVIWTVGEIGAASFIGSIIADLAPAHAQGRYQAAFGWSYAAAQLIGPPVGAFLYGSVGPWALWWSCALLAVLGAAGGLALVKPVRRRTAPPASIPVLENAL